MVLLAAMLAFAANVSLTGCTRAGTTPGQNGRHAWTVPGTLRVAMLASPNTLDPILAVNGYENLLSAFAFDMLVSADAHGEHVARLAAAVPTLANGGISRDGLTVTYHLRRHVKWHDGAPFTSRDVKFSWSAVMNPANNVVSRRGYDMVRRVDTPDAYTVVFHLKQRFAPFVDTVFGEGDQPYRVLPEHLLGKAHDLNRVPFDSAPVGTGPFKFVKWVRGDRLEYVANDAYFLGKPKLQRIVVRIVPDGNTVVNQLRTHDIDFVQGDASIYVQARTIAGVYAGLAPMNAFTATMFNTARPPLDDPRVRRAFVLATDKRALAEEVTHGAADVASEDIPPGLWAYDARVPALGYDPRAAGAMLDAAGWRAGPGGIRTRAGRPLAVQYVYPAESAAARQIAVIVQAQYRRVGIELELKSYTYALLYAASKAGGIIQGGKFDLAGFPWVSGADPDNSSLWLCASIPPNGNNVARYCNPEMDRLQRAAVTQYERAARKRAYARIEALLARDAPAVFQYWPKRRIVHNDDLKGYAPNPVSEAWNAYQWST